MVVHVSVVKLVDEQGDYGSRDDQLVVFVDDTLLVPFDVLLHHVVVVQSILLHVVVVVDVLLLLNMLLVHLLV